MALTVFYDGKCPLCVKEMRTLQNRDKQNQLIFENIYAHDFKQRYPGFDWQALNDRIHAMDEDGKVFIGLDATHVAWSRVGVKWLYAPLRWPLIRNVADFFYLKFAKHRYKISYWITREKRCESDCGDKLK